MPQGAGRQALTSQVTTTLGDHADDFYIDAIVDEISRDYGFIDIDEIPHSEYWDIVEDYDKTRAPNNH